MSNGAEQSSREERSMIAPQTKGWTLAVGVHPQYWGTQLGSTLSIGSDIVSHFPFPRPQNLFIRSFKKIHFPSRFSQLKVILPPKGHWQLFYIVVVTAWEDATGIQRIEVRDPAKHF